MELHQVRYFLALATHKNFTRAAQFCNVTQPALTKSIQKLEHELGGELIYRERQLTQLTELGKIILPQLQAALAAADAVRHNADEFHRGRGASLRIGLTPCISAPLVTEPLLALSEHIPDLRFELIAAPKEDLSALLLQGVVNIALVGDPGPLPARIDQWPLFRERVLVVAPAGSAIATFDVVPVELLADAVWLDRQSCEITQAFLNRHFAGDRQPRLGPRVSEVAHLQDMVSAGLGIILLPEHVSRSPNVIARPIRDNNPTRSVNLLAVAGRQYSPTVAAFIKLTRAWNWAGVVDRNPVRAPLRRLIAVADRQVDGLGIR